MPIAMPRAAYQAFPATIQELQAYRPLTMLEFERSGNYIYCHSRYKTCQSLLACKNVRVAPRGSGESCASMPIATASPSQCPILRAPQ